MPGLVFEPGAILFHVVPGGTLQMGAGPAIDALLGDSALNGEELHALATSLAGMRPVHSVTMQPMLLAAQPLVGRQLAALGWIRDEEVDRLFSEGDEEVTYLELEELAGLLAPHGLRLASEAEYEHAGRAGSQTLFFTGDDIPAEPTNAANPLGFVELGNHRELFADYWHATYDGAPRDQRPWLADPLLGTDGKPMHVTRGGAAGCYPWQHIGEWQLLLASHRDPLDRSVAFHNHQIAVRPARDL